MVRGLFALSLVAAVSACGARPAPPPAAPVAAPASAPAPAVPAPAVPAAPAAVTFPGAPSTRAGAQLAWVLDVLVHHAGAATADELEAHFAPSFLAAVPAAKLQTSFGSLAQHVDGLSITSVRGDDTKLVAKVTVEGKPMRVTLALDPTSGKIEGLLLGPGTTIGPRPTSWDEAAKQVAALAPKAQLLVARLDGGTCKALHAVAPTPELALGSAFKLYVLLALTDRIGAGKLHWTDELAVRDDWKSLPSGITQDAPAGTKLTVREFAERMISISDNTAADTLLYTVGRRAVEAALREARHAKPALDVPFLSTREMFLLKLGPADARAAYLAMPPGKRRAYLDGQLAGKAPSLAGIAGWTGARAIDTLEWFASSEDLCHVMAALAAKGTKPATAAVLDVLSKNPGLQLDKTAFPYIGYKGGSEPGVLNMTYLVKRADGAWFVVTVGFNSAEGGTVDEGKAFGLVEGVFDLLAKEH